MNSTCRTLIVCLATLVAAEKVSAAGPSLGYSNDTRGPLVIQLSTMIGNQERKWQPRSINPRERNFEPIAVPGVKVIYLTVLDPQFRQIAKFPINFTGRDMFYSIQVDPVGTQVDKTLTLRLIEIRLPQPGPGMPGAMPAFPGGFPGAMPGFPGAMPGFPGTMPVTPGVPLPGTVPASGTTPTPPPTNTTAPITPKKN